MNIDATKNRYEFVNDLVASQEVTLEEWARNDSLDDLTAALLRHLERKLEIGTITTVWLQVVQELELKLGLIREGSESTHHYHLLEQRLDGLRYDMTEFWNRWPGFDSLFWYHVDLPSKPEILSALFARQGLVRAQSRSLLALAEDRGDRESSAILKETIHPDEEMFWHWGRDMLEKYLLSARIRSQALEAAQKSYQLILGDGGGE